jgi:three-Cys-motif partner protein
MSTETFFEESREQSIVKATIVHKYFWAWAKVIIPTAQKGRGKIAYIDLFSGPGRYKDGTKSTPLLILEKAIHDENMRKMLVTVFNDRDSDNSRSLQNAIDGLPGKKGCPSPPYCIVKNIHPSADTDRRCCS